MKAQTGNEATSAVTHTYSNAEGDAVVVQDIHCRGGRLRLRSMVNACHFLIRGCKIQIVTDN